MTRTEIVTEYNRIAAPLSAASELDAAAWFALRAAIAAKLVAFLGQFDRKRPLFFENQCFPHQSDSIGERIDWLRAAA